MISPLLRRYTEQRGFITYEFLSRSAAQRCFHGGSAKVKLTIPLTLGVVAAALTEP